MCISLWVRVQGPPKPVFPKSRFLQTRVPEIQRPTEATRMVIRKCTDQLGIFIKFWSPPTPQGEGCVGGAVCYQISVPPPPPPPPPPARPPARGGRAAPPPPPTIFVFTKPTCVIAVFGSRSCAKRKNSVWCCGFSCLEHVPGDSFFFPSGTRAR